MEGEDRKTRRRRDPAAPGRARPERSRGGVGRIGRFGADPHRLAGSASARQTVLGVAAAAGTGISRADGPARSSAMRQVSRPAALAA